MHEIDSTTIETHSRFNVTEHLPVFSNCAHPIILPDGTILNVGLSAGFMGMNYVIFEFPGEKKNPNIYIYIYCNNLGFSKKNTEGNLMHQCRTLAKIPCRWPINPSYMHAFAVTDNYIIIIEQPLCISLVKMAHLTITHGALTDALVWYDKEPVCTNDLFFTVKKNKIFFH